MERRLLGLDALRGIAALMVVAQHLLTALDHRSGNEAATALFSFVDPGKFGVAAFFLISGYVVPFSIRADRPLSDFAVSRAARLLPVLWFSIVTTIGLWIARGEPLPQSAEIATNMALIARPLGYDLVQVPYWTLEWEMAFYVIAALIFATRRAFEPRVLLAVMVASAAATPSIPDAFFLTLMFFGTLLRQERHLRTGASILMLTAISAKFSIPVVVSIALALPAVIAALNWASPARILIWLGAISYPLYLFHPFVISVFKVGMPDGFDGLFAAFAILGSLAIAHSVHVLVEKPGMRLGSLLRSRVTAAPALAPR